MPPDPIPFSPSCGATKCNGLAAEFRSRGAEILEGPEDRSYGQREVTVRECNGLILAFAEDTSARAT